MKLFILYSIWENIFTQKNEIEEILKRYDINVSFISIWCFSWFFWDINVSQFETIIPLLNWLVWKYFFYNWIDFHINEKYIFWKNIFNLEYDDKQIQENNQKVLLIQKEINSSLLITNSKKQEYKNNILTAIYDIGWFLIKTYFLMDEIIINKKELENILNNQNWLQEYKVQAKLLNTLSFNTLENIKNRFDSLDLELKYFAEILYKYFKNIW